MEFKTMQKEVVQKIILKLQKKFRKSNANGKSAQEGGIPGLPSDYDRKLTIRRL